MTFDKLLNLSDPLCSHLPSGEANRTSFIGGGEDYMANKARTQETAGECP